MALETPQTVDIYNLIIEQLELSLGQSIPFLPKAFNRVLASAIAGVFIQLYKYGGFIFLQIFVSKATIEETSINGVLVSPLIEWGILIGIGEPVKATNAELEIDITVENQVGSLEAGTQLTSNKNGVVYITKDAVSLSASTVQAEIVAVNDPSGEGGAGTIGNLDAGEIVSFVNPIGDVFRDAVVNSTTVSGADGESEEAYRQRVVDRFQKRPQGGASADYEQWGEEVEGIINVYPYTGIPGEVDVYSEATPESSGDPDGIPTQAQLDAVKASIEKDEAGLATRRPITAFVNSLAIRRTGFEVKVFDLNVQDQATVEAEIENSLTEYFLDRAPFVDGLTVPPRADKISINTIIGIIDDSVNSRNGTFTNATFNVFGFITDLDLYILAEGEKSKLVNVFFL